MWVLCFLSVSRLTSSLQIAPQGRYSYWLACDVQNALEHFRSLVILWRGQARRRGYMVAGRSMTRRTVQLSMLQDAILRAWYQYLAARKQIRLYKLREASGMVDGEAAERCWAGH